MIDFCRVLICEFGVLNSGVAMDVHADGCDESAQDLSHEVCVYHHEQTACSLSACTPRVR